AADGRRSKDFISQLVLSHKLKLRGVCLENEGLARFVGGEEILTDEHWRSGKRSADPLLPEFFSRFARPAGGNAGVLDCEQVAIFDDHGRNINLDVVFPRCLGRPVGENGLDMLAGPAAADKYALAIGD